jgi:crotonobetainyl-CoA:carnitine CoA-transferase CaiB-like acyl-CoA transferase
MTRSRERSEAEPACASSEAAELHDAAVDARHQAERAELVEAFTWRYCSRCDCHDLCSRIAASIPPAQRFGVWVGVWHDPRTARREVEVEVEVEPQPDDAEVAA